jgi:hypothetical protein
VNNAKVRDVRANLMRAVDKELRAQKRDHEIPGALAAISSAPLDSFTPQLWKIKLSQIDNSRYSCTHQYQDECNIPDLASSEFDVIVE